MFGRWVLGVESDMNSLYLYTAFGHLHSAASLLNAIYFFAALFTSS
jgi:hypothetical protein